MPAYPERRRQIHATQSREDPGRNARPTLVRGSRSARGNHFLYNWNSSGRDHRLTACRQIGSIKPVQQHPTEALSSRG
jgi:hypothetical protein